MSDSSVMSGSSIMSGSSNVLSPSDVFTSSGGPDSSCLSGSPNMPIPADGPGSSDVSGRISSQCGTFRADIAVVSDFHDSALLPDPCNTAGPSGVDGSGFSVFSGSLVDSFGAWTGCAQI